MDGKAGAVQGFQQRRSDCNRFLIMADYATPAEIKGFAAQDTAAALSDANWAILATAASRLFDNLAEVEEGFFASAGSSSAKTFIGNGTAYLKLPPFTELVGEDEDDPVVIIADDEYEVPDYELVGSSLVVLDRTQRQNFNEFSPSTRFEGWRDGIKITVWAKWGFTAVPKDIVYAVIQIAHSMWKQADPSFASVANVDGSLAQVSVPATAQKIIDKYREEYSQRALFA